MAQSRAAYGKASVHTGLEARSEALATVQQLALIWKQGSHGDQRVESALAIVEKVVRGGAPLSELYLAYNMAEDARWQKPLRPQAVANAVRQLSAPTINWPEFRRFVNIAEEGRPGFD